METNRSQVRAYLENWANTKSKPHFAVLIESHWGCGKTHFILGMLEDKNLTDRKSIYLSTFGIPSVQSLETNLFYASANMLTKTLHKSAGFAGSNFSGALTLGSGGIFGGAANLNKVVEAATSQLEQSAKNMDGALLVLDDLERCQILMADLLGVVNRFVEHGDTRVILIANTVDLEDEHFGTFREKVVGHSFFLASDPDQALSTFVSEISTQRVRSVSELKILEIRKLYDLSGYHNLRALRQYIWQLAAMIERMDECYHYNEKLLRSLFTQSFIFFFEFKLDLSVQSKLLNPSDLRGKYSEAEGDSRHVYDFKLDKEEEPSLKAQVLKKYHQQNGITTIVTVNQWISILISGVVDANWLNQELAQADEVAGVEAWPSWKRLWHFHDWDFSDGSEPEFWRDVADMQINISNGSYLEVGEFLHVVGVSIMLAEQDLVEKSVADTFAELGSYVDRWLVPQLNYDRWHVVKESFGRHLDAYDGLAFIGRDEAYFQSVRNYLAQRSNEWYQTWLDVDAGTELLAYLPDNLITFLGNLKIINHSSEQRYLNFPILANIDAADFVDAWFTLAHDKERLVISSLKERYEYRPELLDTEGPWWRKVQEELAQRISISTSKPRNVQLRNNINHINSSIIELWELRQFYGFHEGNLSDLAWMTRKRIDGKGT